MNTPHRSRRRRLVVAAFSLVLAACGSDQEGPSVPAHADVVVIAPSGRGLVFDQNTYTARAGDVAIAYRNDDVQVHTMIIEDATGKKVPGFKRLILRAHKATDTVVNLVAGDYTIVCDIHLPTMVAKLTVNP